MWDDDYNDPDSEKYIRLVNAITNWLNRILGDILDKYGLHLDLTFRIIGPSRRRRVAGGDDFTPELEVDFKLDGEMSSGDDLKTASATINDEIDQTIGQETAEGGDGEFIDETEVPQTEEFDLCSVKASTTICESDRLGAMIPICAMPDDAVPYLGSDESCTGTVVGDYLLFESSDDCPLSSVTTDTHIIHSGSINWVDGHRGAVITRQRTVNVDFECTFQTAFTLSTNGIDAVLTTIELDLGSEQGMVDLTLGLWETNKFDAPLSSTAVVEVPDFVHVAAILESDGPMVTIMQNCWATAGDDVNDKTRFQFITDGCGDENELDAETLVIYSTGVSSHSAFSIQSFQFHHSDTEVFFHCQVTLCDPALENCTPSCSSNARKRRTTVTKAISEPISIKVTLGQH